MQDRVLKAENVTVHWNSQVVDVLGDQFITGLRLKDTVTGEERELEVGGMFVAIGHTPATSFLEGCGLEADDKGYLHLNTRSSETNIEGVFAAGDVADARYRQAVTAAGMGCQAALDAEHWLGSKGLI
jgi:thioredoxin reductase (NADPH)